MTAHTPSTARTTAAARPRPRHRGRGTGTQTVVDCQGPSLLCSDIENGSTAFYTAQDLDASDPDAITWRVDVVVDLGPFGIADSASTFAADRDG